mmetsp:Transcript_5622/g.11242  ORF Transcript_5622/g.11242 Transcript_5622/m.11242 type:complete len:201 (+) Transcript_5622:346-948(+)
MSASTSLAHRGDQFLLPNQPSPVAFLYIQPSWMTLRIWGELESGVAKKPYPSVLTLAAWSPPKVPPFLSRPSLSYPLSLSLSQFSANVESLLLMFPLLSVVLVLMTSFLPAAALISPSSEEESYASLVPSALSLTISPPPPFSLISPPPINGSPLTDRAQLDFCSLKGRWRSLQLRVSAGSPSHFPSTFSKVSMTSSRLK